MASRRKMAKAGGAERNSQRIAGNFCRGSVKRKLNNASAWQMAGGVAIMRISGKYARSGDGGVSWHNQQQSKNERRARRRQRKENRA